MAETCNLGKVDGIRRRYPPFTMYYKLDGQIIQQYQAQCISPLHAKLYYEFGKFRENFIFTNNVKRHICEVKS